MDSGITDEGYQDQILPHVSRTFALTIPQLPPRLKAAVTNAYLLCRIADTIEDEPALSPADTLALLERFKSVVAGRGDAAALAADVEKRLSGRTLATERDLIVNMARVLNVTASLSPPQRSAIQRCVDLMCYGMPRFQSATSLEGLSRRSDLDEYCYYVAGVVGDMLTELFCEYSPDIAKNRAQLSKLAVSFAQGLQMTNILKDVWEDRSRGACWLPREVFAPHHVDLGAPFARDRRPRLRCRHARADRRGACASAQCLGLHVVHPGRRDRDPAFLSMGNRTRGAYIAKNS